MRSADSAEPAKMVDEAGPPRPLPKPRRRCSDGAGRPETPNWPVPCRCPNRYKLLAAWPAALQLFELLRPGYLPGCLLDDFGVSGDLPSLAVDDLVVLEG